MKKLKDYKWRILISIITGIIFISLYYILEDLFSIRLLERAWILTMLLGLSVISVGLFLYPIIKSLMNNIKKMVQQLSIRKLSLIIFGLLLGILLSYSLSNFVLFPFLNEKITVFINTIIIIITIYIILLKEEEIASLFLEKSPIAKNNIYYSNTPPKLLDTSAIIDGRILEVYQNGFLNGVLIVPNFVLEELQHIADSKRDLKRKKGRHGMKKLKKLQDKLEDNIVILDKKISDQEVDHKLVHLAKDLNAELITNDYNLSQLAELQEVTVININKLANSLKLILLPGEKKKVEIIKKGQERGQGIAYLQNGTMIVVDQGEYHIGEKMEVVISSLLQKDSGRMYFARPFSDKVEQKRNSVV